GCAQVASDSGQNTVYYIGDTGISSTRGGTWPDPPAFFLFDVPAGGPYEFTATAGTSQVATDVPVIVPDAVTFVLLLFHDASNPTPVECE
ncbi:MAG: hypothetical protein IT350_14810, partial [Deltaproteobacteria bacterium]|nr:hypothetical protein [Deltaproteobacteria bacterium]